MPACSRVQRLLAVLLGCLLLGVWGVPIALAESQTASADLVRVVSVTAHPSEGDGSALTIEATVDYTLATAPRGFLLLFFFEDAEETSTPPGDSVVWVEAGTGRAVLQGSLAPHPGTRELTVLAALFENEETLLGWSVTNAFSLAPWPARSAFAKAMAARLGGQHQAAVEALTEAMQHDPQTPHFAYWRADSYVRLGQYEAAIEDYSRVLASLPGHRPSLVGRGVAHLWKGEWAQAIADLERVLAQKDMTDRWTAWAYRARGLARAALGKMVEAIADYQAYLLLSPTAPDRAEVERSISDLQALLGQQTAEGSSPGVAGQGG